MPDDLAGDAERTVECYQCHGLGEIAVGYDQIQVTCAVCEGSGRISIRRIQRAAFEKGAAAQREADLQAIHSVMDEHLPNVPRNTVESQYNGACDAYNRIHCMQLVGFKEEEG